MVDDSPPHYSLTGLLRLWEELVGRYQAEESNQMAGPEQDTDLGVRWGFPNY